MTEHHPPPHVFEEVLNVVVEVTGQKIEVCFSKSSAVDRIFISSTSQRKSDTAFLPTFFYPTTEEGFFSLTAFYQMNSPIKIQMKFRSTVKIQFVTAPTAKSNFFSMFQNIFNKVRFLSRLEEKRHVDIFRRGCEYSTGREAFIIQQEF